MASSIKTRPKTTLGPISGGTLLVPSCTNMQKTDISEICSTRLYTVKCYLRVPRSDQAEIRIMRSFFRGDFNRAIRSIGTVFIKFLGNYPQVSQRHNTFVKRFPNNCLKV